MLLSLPNIRGNAALFLALQGSCGWEYVWPTQQPFSPFFLTEAWFYKGQLSALPIKLHFPLPFSHKGNHVTYQEEIHSEITSWGCGESSSGGSCLQCHVSFLPFALLFFLPMFSTMLDIDLPLGTMTTLKMTRWNDLDYITELLHQPQAASSRLPVIRKIKPQFVQVTVLKSQIQFLNRRPQRHLYLSITRYATILWDLGVFLLF